MLAVNHVGITHILNAAQGPDDASGIKFLGFCGEDFPEYELSRHFQEAADYVQGALDTGGRFF
jgi:hypothetical protein